MNSSPRFPLLPLLGLSLLLAPSPASAAASKLEYTRDGSGVSGYRDTPRLPWCGFLVHDPDRPVPPRLDPGPAPAAPAAVPADAIVLFGGRDLAAWQPSDWRVANGVLVAESGRLVSKESFGDAQIHVEWLAPADFQGTWENRGNNGVMLMGLYEIQIYDSFHEKLYADGQAASIYGQTPPRVNVTRRPGEWQTYDIFFTAPRFEGGRLVAPARVTMLHNGVLVHLNEEIRGETGHRVLPAYRQQISRGPLALAGHKCPVQFRSIWVRRL
jgi:hypothetical protein